MCNHILACAIDQNEITLYKSDARIYVSGVHACYTLQHQSTTHRGQSCTLCDKISEHENMLATKVMKTKTIT